MRRRNAAAEYVSRVRSGWPQCTLSAANECIFVDHRDSLQYRLSMDFRRDELVWINNALAEVIGGPDAIEDWEFHTRIGGDRDEVRALLQRVHDQVGAVRRADPNW